MTTPTPDRLAALEAAVKAAGNVINEVRFTGYRSATKERLDDSELWAAFEEAIRAALDAASPLTTPTPDQGALERVSPDFVEPPMRSIARKILARVEAAQAPGDDSDRQEAWSIIEDALTTAASEARAAAVEECAKTCDEDSAYWREMVLVYYNNRMSAPVHSLEYLEAVKEHGHAAAMAAHSRLRATTIRALATPAQSETR